MNIEWKLKIEHKDKPTIRWKEELMNVKSDQVKDWSVKI